MIRTSLLFAFVALALAGCESTTPDPVIGPNTVTGEGFGFNGYEFDIPPGYTVYDPWTDEETSIVQIMEARAEKFAGSGYSPYYVILQNSDNILAFIPRNQYLRTSNSRVSDMQSHGSARNYSLLNTNDQLTLLRNYAAGISIHGDKFTDPQASSELVNGVPIGEFTCMLEVSENRHLLSFTLYRLGNLKDLYTVIGLSTIVAGDEGVDAGKELLSTIRLD